MSTPAEILLVDDNEDDVLLVQRAFAQTRILNRVRVARTGEEALEYLRGTGRYADRLQYPIPSLILLDLKLPGLSGFDVLRWIRLQPGLTALRVVVLTASQDIRDLNAAYQMGANSFLVKPNDFERLAEITQALSGYWLWLDRAPETERAPTGSHRDVEPTGAETTLARSSGPVQESGVPAPGDGAYPWSAG